MTTTEATEPGPAEDYGLAAQPTYREATDAANWTLFQHCCGSVRAFSQPPTSGWCNGRGRICPDASEDPADWQPLYRRNEEDAR